MRKMRKNAFFLVLAIALLFPLVIPLTANASTCLLVIEDGFFYQKETFYYEEEAKFEAHSNAIVGFVFTHDGTRNVFLAVTAARFVIDVREAIPSHKWNGFSYGRSIANHWLIGRRYAGGSLWHVHMPMDEVPGFTNQISKNID